MILLENKKEIETYYDELHKERKEVLYKRFKYNKAVLIEIGDIFKCKCGFNDEKFVFIGVIHDEKDIPMDVNCYYISAKNPINGLNRHIVKNNDEKRLIEVSKYVKDNKEKFMYTDDEKDSVKYKENIQKIKNLNRLYDNINNKDNIKYELKKYMGGKCVRCNNGYISELNFHKKDNAKCKFQIPLRDLIEEGKIDDAIEESDNYELLCNSCLNELNHFRNCKEDKNLDMTNPYIANIVVNRFNKKTLKSALVIYRGGKCSKCGYKNKENLSFVHKTWNKNNRKISDLIKEGAYVGNIIKEADKCDLYCEICLKRLFDKKENKK